MRVFLSLGSNLGNRKQNLDAAIVALESLKGVKVVSCSRIYETEPMGRQEQPLFLNMAMAVETVLKPLELLDAVKRIEKQLGRVSTAPRWSARQIDIDLILWGEQIVSEKRLQVPHPAFRNRAFVLTPLEEIASDVQDPVTGLTVRALANAPGEKGKVWLWTSPDH